GDKSRCLLDHLFAKMRQIRAVKCALAAALLGWILSGMALSHTAAQGTVRPNAAVSIYNSVSADQPPTTSSLGVFAPGNPKMTKLAELAPDAIMDVSGFLAQTHP